MTYIMKDADVGMIQTRNDLRFTLEPLADIRPCSQLFGQHLDCNGSIQTCVGCLIDFTHAAGADRGDDFIGTEFRARTQAHDLRIIRTASPFARKLEPWEKFRRRTPPSRCVCSQPERRPETCSRE